MEIQCEVLKVLKEVKTHNEYKWEIRIVRWNNGDPQLEKRQFQQKDDEWRAMRAKGFTFEDCQFLQEHLDEILDVMDKE